MQKFLLICLLTIFFTQFTPLHAQQALSLEEVISLKDLGYSEQDILQELKSTKSKFKLTEEQIKRLKKAGFSDLLIRWMQKSSPKLKINIDTIISWKKEGLSSLAILKKISKGSLVKTLKLRDALRLRRAKVHVSILIFLQKRPIQKQDILRLAHGKTDEKIYQFLFKKLGVEYKPRASESLKLMRLGVPRAIVRKLVKRKAVVVPEETPFTSGPSEKFAHYQHVGKDFAIQYPSDWNIVREIEHGTITYAFSESKGKIKRMKQGFFLQRLAISTGSVFHRLKREAIYKKVFSLVKVEEPKLVSVGEPKDVLVNGIKAKKSFFRGPLDAYPDKIFTLWVTAVVKDKFVYLIYVQAEKSEWERFEKIYEKMLEKIRLGRPQTEQRNKQWRPEELVEKYKESVVSVVSGYEGKAHGSGSGFIIREDGYLITNHHVVWDAKKKRFFTHFKIEWDSSLNKDGVEAVLVGAKRESSDNLLRRLTLGGVDIALLKITEGGPYKPVKLTPLRNVRLGDSVVAMGFPRRSIFRHFGGGDLSIFITRGGLVRFNRNEHNEVRSIYTDAKITHGNSGGPCFNLATGGVFGINTFGAWHSIERDIPKLKQLQLGDLVGYYGVLPIRYVLKEFPQYCYFPAHYDRHFAADDYLILARDFLDQGLHNAALKEVQKALKLRGNDPDALEIKGMCHLFLGKYKKALEIWKKSLKHNPKHFNTLMLLAIIYSRMKEYLTATDYVERAIQVRPKNYEGYIERGRIYLAIKRYDDAMGDAKKASELTKDLIPAPSILAGEILYAQEKFDEGREYFKKALAANEWEVKAWLGLGAYYEHKNMHLAAVSEYAKLRRKLSEDPKAWEAIARCYRKSKEYTKAYEQYNKALQKYKKAKLNPSEEMLYQFGWLAHQALKKYDSAIIIYRMYLKHYINSKKSWRVHLDLAKIYQEKNMCPGLSWAHLKVASAVSPENEKLKEEMKNFTPSPISAKDLIVMAKLKYPPLAMVMLMLRSQLGFRITTKKQVAILIKAGVPPAVLIVILKLQKKRGYTPTTPTTPTRPTRPTRPTYSTTSELDGIWTMSLYHRGMRRIVILKIQNGKYLEATYSSTKQLLASYTGIIKTTSSTTLYLQPVKPMRRNAVYCNYRLTRTSLSIEVGTRWFHYRRVQ